MLTNMPPKPNFKRYKQRKKSPLRRHYDTQLPHFPQCTLFAPPPPPQILHNFCFSLLLGITREIENNTWGANKVHYGRSASDVRDFMARNCLDNGMQSQTVGYKRIL